MFTSYIEIQLKANAATPPASFFGHVLACLHRANARYANENGLDPNRGQFAIVLPEASTRREEPRVKIDFDPNDRVYLRELINAVKKKRDIFDPIGRTMFVFGSETFLSWLHGYLEANMPAIRDMAAIGKLADVDINPKTGKPIASEFVRMVPRRYSMPTQARAAAIRRRLEARARKRDAEAPSIATVLERLQVEAKKANAQCPPHLHVLSSRGCRFPVYFQVERKSAAEIEEDEGGFNTYGLSKGSWLPVVASSV
ncbi:MAG: type I-F CRISPR-associated endoribonuclease Cas6/Csy4 [Azospirillum sp.]|nr:type I-F CRISPR-associated endoribonuclease Cas6/Csy4 [Azospirillum sp.]